jgi:hypothetical protein
LKGIRLDDGRSVGDYEIIKGTTLDLNTGASVLQVFVKTIEGKKVSYEVNAGDSVKMLKQQIEGKESMVGGLLCVCKQERRYKGRKVWWVDCLWREDRRRKVWWVDCFCV